MKSFAQFVFRANRAHGEKDNAVGTEEWDVDCRWTTTGSMVPGNSCTGACGSHVAESLVKVVCAVGGCVRYNNNNTQCHHECNTQCAGSIPANRSAPIPFFAVVCRAARRKPSSHTQDETHCSCLLYTSPSPRDLSTSRMPSSA